MANDVNFSIGADTKSAEKSIDSLGNSLKTIQKFAAAALAVFAGKQVVDFFSAGTDAAIAQEKAMAALSQQLKLSGDFSDEALVSFAAFGDQMELVSQFGDDVVISQVAVAKAMGLTNEESKKLVQAAIELSAATGDSLDASVQALGKTFDGITGKSPVLKNALSGLSTEALKAGKGLDAVLKSLGGSSEAQIQTFAGSLKQAENAFGNFQESFGKLIIENPALLAGIKAITEVFRLLQGQVEKNTEAFGSFITLSIQGLATAFSLVLPVIGFFVRALQGAQTLVTLSVGLFQKLAEVVGKVLAYSIGGVTLLFLKLTDAIDKTSRADSFEKFALGYLDKLQSMTDSTLEFAANNNESFIQFNNNYEGFGDTVDGLAQKVFESNTKQVKSTQNLQVETKKSFDLSAKDIDKLRSEFESFYNKIEGSAVESLDNQLKAYEDYLDEYERLAESGTIAQEKLLKLRENIQRNHEEKVTSLVRRETEERQKEVEKIIGEKNIFQQIELFFDEDQAKDVQDSLAEKFKKLAFEVGVSAVSAVSNGAQGAGAVSDLISGLVSKIPIFGGLVSELIKLAAQAPEENKKNIQGFAKGIPEFLSNINTNLGSLSEILNEVIGPIIEEVLTSSGLGSLFRNLWKNLVKVPELIRTIAIGVRDGLRGSGGELSDAFKKGIADTKAELGRIGSGISNFFGTFFEQIKGAFAFVFADNPLLNELISMKELLVRAQLVVEFIAQLFSSIPGALVQIRDLISGITEKFNSSFENLGAKFTDGFLQIRDSFANLFSGLADAIKALPKQIGDALSQLFEGLRKAIAEAFSSDKLKPGTGGIGGTIKGGNTGGLNLPKLATGITEVPSGFENDGFLARLSSGERVVDRNSNQDLKEFLANSKSAGLGNEQMIALLSDISSKLGNSSATTIELTLDKKVLSKTILDLNRRNERLSV